MKRFVASILALLILATSTGMTVHAHYCMGKLITASLLDNGDAHKCSNCGMVKKSSKKGCCRNEHRLLKNNDTTAVNTATISYTLLFEAVPQAFILYAGYCHIDCPEHIFTCSSRPHGPPLRSTLRTHILHGVFLI